VHLGIGVALQSLRIRWLQIFSSWGLHLDDTSILRPEANIGGRRCLATIDSSREWRFHCSGMRKQALRGRQDESLWVRSGKGVGYVCLLMRPMEGGCKGGGEWRERCVERRSGDETVNSCPASLSMERAQCKEGSKLQVRPMLKMESL